MRKPQEHWTSKTQDAALGYSVLVLGLLVFILVLVAVTAITRFIVGAGA